VCVELASLELVGGQRAVGLLPPVPHAHRLAGQAPSHRHKHAVVARKGGTFNTLPTNLNTVPLLCYTSTLKSRVRVNSLPTNLHTFPHYCTNTLSSHVKAAHSTPCRPTYKYIAHYSRIKNIAQAGSCNTQWQHFPSHAGQCCRSGQFLTGFGSDFRKRPDPDLDLNKFSANFFWKFS
jgi:hypothetical protein